LEATTLRFQKQDGSSPDRDVFQRLYLAGLTSCFDDSFHQTFTSDMGIDGYRKLEAI
jgi:hypothetical protein